MTEVPLDAETEVLREADAEVEAEDPQDAEIDLSSSDSPNEIMYKPRESIEVVNQCSIDLGETPVTKR